MSPLAVMGSRCRALSPAAFGTRHGDTVGGNSARLAMSTGRYRNGCDGLAGPAWADQGVDDGGGRTDLLGHGTNSRLAHHRFGFPALLRQHDGDNVTGGAGPGCTAGSMQGG